MNIRKANRLEINDFFQRKKKSYTKNPYLKLENGNWKYYVLSDAAKAEHKGKLLALCPFIIKH